MTTRGWPAAAALPPADDRLFGPYAFGAGWLAAGVAALLLAAGVVVWMRRSPRPPRIEPAPGPRDTRDRYLAELDGLEREFAAERVEPRELHHELSRLLRRFAADEGTTGAHAMSAGALASAGHASVAAAVRRYEDPQFAESPDRDPAAAIELARSVVTERRMR